MTSRGRVDRLLALLLIAAACTACAGADADYGEVEYSVQTLHFDVLVHPGAQLLCAGEYPAIDDLVDLTRTAVGYSGSETRADLHLWRFDAPEFPCPAWAEGCVLQPSDEIHVRGIASLHHEVVHAAITSELADFYSEGFATTLTTRITSDPGLAFDPRPLLDADNSEFEYWQAAVFVNFMIERFGADIAFAASLDASHRGAELAFAEVTGQSVDEIAEAFIAAPFHCSSQIIWCAAPGEVVQDEWTFDSAFACTDARTLGVDQGERVVTTLDVSGGTYLIELDHGSVQIESCAVCSERTSWAASSATPGGLSAEFKPGRYSVIIDSEPGFTTHVRITRQG